MLKYKIPQIVTLTQKESNANALDSFFHITLLILKITNTK